MRGLARHGARLLGGGIALMVGLTGVEPAAAGLPRCFGAKADLVIEGTKGVGGDETTTPKGPNVIVIRGLERLGGPGTGLMVGSGNDRICGTTRANIGLGSGDDRARVRVLGGEDHFLLGGSGSDQIAYLGGSGASVDGQSGDDRLLIDGERMEAAGGSGNDQLQSVRAGSLLGQAGNDLLSGSSGIDALDGGSGTDTCDGGGSVGDQLDRCETVVGVP